FADECREKQRPGFVDLHTYRYQGHSMSDPQKYRTKDEVDKVKERDSIDLLAKRLMAGEKPAMTEAQFLEMQKEIKDIVRDAVDFAEKAEVPALEELYSDVYVNIQPNLSPIRDYVKGEKNPLL